MIKEFLNEGVDRDTAVEQEEEDIMEYMDFFIDGNKKVISDMQSFLKDAQKYAEDELIKVIEIVANKRIKK